MNHLKLFQYSLIHRVFVHMTWHLVTFKQTKMLSSLSQSRVVYEFLKSQIALLHTQNILQFNIYTLVLVFNGSET